MAIDNRDLSGADTLNMPALNESDERNWWWSPEPVRLTQAPAQRFAPTRFDVITASFQFPITLVDARAQAMVEEACRGGARHSLSLWQAALRRSLERISREAAHAPDAAVCAALFWDRVGEEYRVAVTFEVAPQREARTTRH